MTTEEITYREAIRRARSRRRCGAIRQDPDHGRGHRPVRRARSRPARGSTRSSAPPASATRRSPRPASSAPRSASRSPATGRSPRSCSPISSASASTRSSTASPSTASCRAARSRRRWSIRAIGGAGLRFGAAAFADRRILDAVGAGPQDRLPVDPGARPIGMLQGGDPRRQPGAGARAQGAAVDEGPGRRSAATPLPMPTGPKMLREGRDVTIVASLAMVGRSLAAADLLAGRRHRGRGHRHPVAPAARRRRRSPRASSGPTSSSPSRSRRRPAAGARTWSPT